MQDKAIFACSLSRSWPPWIILFQSVFYFFSRYLLHIIPLVFRLFCKLQYINIGDKMWILHVSVYVYLCASVFVRKQTHLYKMANVVEQRHLDLMIFNLFFISLAVITSVLHFWQSCNLASCCCCGTMMPEEYQQIISQILSYCLSLVWRKAVWFWLSNFRTMCITPEWIRPSLALVHP